MPKTQVDTSIDEKIEERESDSHESLTREDRIAPRYQKVDYYHQVGHGNRKSKWAEETWNGSYKELVLPNLSGQYRLWKSQLRRRSDMADNVVLLGNFIGVQDEAIDPLEKNRTVYNGNNGVIQALVKFYAHSHNGFDILIGVNEVAALFAPDVYLCSERSLEILAENWFDPEGTLKVASVIDGKLATHRGLTYLEWLNIGRPETAELACELLNEKWKGANADDFSDCYFNSGVPNHAVSPIWADVFYETYSSWIVAPESCPFDQIHSGGGMHTESGRMFLNDKSTFVQFLDKKNISLAKWGSSVKIKDSAFISAHTTETEENTIVKKLKKTTLLEYQTKISNL